MKSFSIKKKSSFAPGNNRYFDPINESSVQENIENKELINNKELKAVLKIISNLCRQNREVAKIYLPMVEVLIRNELFELAKELLPGNQYFLAQFNKLGWY